MFRETFRNKFPDIISFLKRVFLFMQSQYYYLVFIVVVLFSLIFKDKMYIFANISIVVLMLISIKVLFREDFFSEKEEGGITKKKTKIFTPGLPQYHLILIVTTLI